MIGTCQKDVSKGSHWSNLGQYEHQKKKKIMTVKNKKPYTNIDINN